MARVNLDAVFDHEFRVRIACWHKLTADGCRRKKCLEYCCRSGVCCLWFQASSPAYSADAMAARLAVIPLEGQTVEDVAAAVVAACQEFGVEMRRFDSKKSSKEPGARLTVVGLACKHAMKNRQKEYLAGDAGGVHKT